MAALVFLGILLLPFAATKTLVSVRMTSPVFFQNGISTRSSVYWSINQKRIDVTYTYTYMVIRQKNGTSYWPFNATQIAGPEHTKVTNTTIKDFNFQVWGVYNTPFYGPGLYVNWTLLPQSYQGAYFYHYKRIDLGLAPLSQICLRDCYCLPRVRHCV